MCRRPSRLKCHSGTLLIHIHMFTCTFKKCNRLPMTKLVPSATRILAAFLLQFTALSLQLNGNTLQIQSQGKTIINGVDSVFVCTNLGVHVQTATLGRLTFETLDPTKARQRWDSCHGKIMETFDSMWPDCPPPPKALGYNSRPKNNETEQSDRHVADVTADIEYVTTDFKMLFSSLAWRASERRYDRNKPAVQSLCDIMSKICNLGVQIKFQCPGRLFNLINTSYWFN